MTATNKSLIVLLIAVFAVIVSIFLPAKIQAYLTKDVDYSFSDINRFYHYTMFSATTTQATSTPIIIAGAAKTEVYFTRLGASNSVATSTFNVQVSPDGTNWYDYNKLISNVSNTNGQTMTRVSSVSLVGATSTTIVALDLQFDTFRNLRCISTQASTTLETTDGSTCTVSVLNKI